MPYKACYWHMLDGLWHEYNDREDIEVKVVSVPYYYKNYDLFTDVEKVEREKKLQETLVQIKHRYGKNAILKGMNALDFATAKKRNTLIGGHNAY